MRVEEVRRLMNEAGQKGVPFLFGFDFALSEAFFVANPLAQEAVLFRVGVVSNAVRRVVGDGDGLSGEGLSGVDSLDGQMRPELSCRPLAWGAYKKRFAHVMRGLRYGNSFLTNLTIATPVETPFSAAEIFTRSTSPYALYLPGRFVCFSPETFVRIKGHTISSCPMKGTIDAALPDAERRILDSPKERCEHDTIVDLIRNDLGRVAEKVAVNRYRYIDRVEGHNGQVLQVSSEITATLPEGYRARLGDILYTLLPAGSVSGAPKEATLRIIREAERGSRGYYTGVFGYFDGEMLDSAVLIRYIEIRNEKLYYRSGGGITTQSRCRAEYLEALQKVYLPFR